jgi:hypothetical protein
MLGPKYPFTCQPAFGKMLLGQMSRGPVRTCAGRTAERRLCCAVFKAGKDLLLANVAVPDLELISRNVFFLTVTDAPAKYADVRRLPTLNRRQASVALSTTRQPG